MYTIGPYTSHTTYETACIQRIYYYIFLVVLLADRTPPDHKSTANFAPQRDNYTPADGAVYVILLLSVNRMELNFASYTSVVYIMITVAVMNVHAAPSIGPAIRDKRRTRLYNLIDDD